MRKLKYARVPEHGLQVEETLAAGDSDGAYCLTAYWWAWTVRRAMGFQPGRRPLVTVDLGCGSGYGSRILAEGLTPGAAVLGVDLDREGLNLARKDHGDAPGLSFIEACGPRGLDQDWGLTGQLPAQVDLFVAMDVLEYMQHRDLFLDQLCRRLAPGGAALLSCPGLNRTDPVVDAMPADAYFRYDAPLLFRVLGRHFGTVLAASSVLDGAADPGGVFAHVDQLRERHPLWGFGRDLFYCAAPRI